ncbi:hypothetical protein ACH5RR_039057 [Cinchona calisaya]|uniref:Uncharacterized protein n=1 Tax=Cinchona calisaya TaxID=153742 RepID=A0ABD2XX55_9GENT
MQAMMIGASSVKEQLASMARAVEKLSNSIEEKDPQIATLVSKLEYQNIGKTSQVNNNKSDQNPQMDEGAKVYFESSSRRPVDDNMNLLATGAISIQWVILCRAEIQHTSMIKQMPISKDSMALQVFKYVPKALRREGELPFVEVSTSEISKPANMRALDAVDHGLLEKHLTVPLEKQKTVAKPPLEGFVKSVRDESLPQKRTTEGFDLKAYKLMANAEIGTSIQENDGLSSRSSVFQRIQRDGLPNQEYFSVSGRLSSPNPQDDQLDSGLRPSVFRI